jgi:kinesin family member 1
MSDRRRRSKNSIFYNPSTLSTTKSTTASASNQKIQVACRTRPLSSKERGERNVISSPSPQVVNITDPSVYRIVDSKHDSRLRLSDWTRTFRFDYVFSEDDTQLDIMNKIGVPMITNALQGYNTTLFAYGQTGSGKTYTMLGHFSDQLGLVPRMCDALFRRRRPRSSSAFSVEISFMEIYNERVRDLLTSSSSSSSNLRVREHPRQGVYVEDLSSFAVSSYDEVMKLLSRGSLARTTSSTQMNSRSSRSHAIFQIKLRMRLRNESRTSTVSLVDLAGSERSRTITSRDRERDRLQQRETSSINKSLSTLGDVINALCASRRRDGVHVCLCVCVFYF